MRIRFLADEDLDAGIVAGIRKREAAVDILDAKQSGLRGTKDPELLELAAQHGRILISHDRRTMTRFFRTRQMHGRSSPGLLIVPQGAPIGEVVESLLLIWNASEAAEWMDRIVFLPFR